MMARYGRAPKPTSWNYDEDEPFRPNLTVDDHKPVKTGLLWPDGEPIMRLPNPMGFGRNEDWFE
jgi:hypothetical protein